jgi:hypothetical protein
MKELKNNKVLECPLGGDETNDCESCVYSGEYSFFDGECIERGKAEYLNEKIKEHNEGKCNCDLTDGGMGLCLAGEYLESCRTLYEVLEDIEVE